jgi:hypothetical protein
VIWRWKARAAGATSMDRNKGAEAPAMAGF